jgi:predicted methyltransferase
LRHLALASVLVAAACLQACREAPQPPAPTPAPPQAAASVAADPARAKDVELDARRKGPQIVAFAEVKPGQKVLDLIPGSGYFTRLFSLSVGPTGKIYAVWPQHYDKVSQPDSPTMRKLAAQAPFTNVVVLVQPTNSLSAPEPLDLVFTSQNYHDYPLKFMGPSDPAILNKAVFAALKPGGLYIIVDHSAAAGSGMRDPEKLHRIDVEAVKAQVQAAGFRFEGESDLLRNPQDTRTTEVFDPSIRGHTDQFILKFRKPAA